MYESPVVPSARKAAAAIYLVTALAYLCWNVIAIIYKGLNSWFGLLVEAVITASLLYLAYSLYRPIVGARWPAIFTSACFVAGSGFILVDVFLPPTFWDLPASVPLAAIRSFWWVDIAVFLTVCVAHLTVILLLLFAKRAPDVAT
jgi:hypothetical protein